MRSWLLQIVCVGLALLGAASTLACGTTCSDSYPKIDWALSKDGGITACTDCSPNWFEQGQPEDAGGSLRDAGATRLTPLPTWTPISPDAAADDAGANADAGEPDVGSATAHEWLNQDCKASCSEAYAVTYPNQSTLDVYSCDPPSVEDGDGTLLLHCTFDDRACRANDIHDLQVPVPNGAFR